MRERPETRTEAEQPLTILYDAECGLCNWILSVLLRWDRGGRLQPIALQRPEAHLLLADLAPAEREASWHLVFPTGARRSGAAAIASLLGVLPHGRVPAAVVARFPGLTDRGYRWLVEHRSQLSRWLPTSVKRRARERLRV